MKSGTHISPQVPEKCHHQAYNRLDVQVGQDKY